MYKTKYWVPGVMGVLIYFVFVAINDIYSPNWDRWARGWITNTIEVFAAVFFGYLCAYIANYWEGRFKKKPTSFDSKSIFMEFLKVFLTCIVVLNVIGGPIFHVIDGYEWHDVLLLNTIPVICTLLYFAVLRGNFYFEKLVEAKTQTEKLTNDKLNEELKFLRNQIHPHFMFNALNTIYFQMDESVTGAKRTIEKFSELLRYRLYDHDTEKVSLQEEIKYLEGYIELEKLKHDGRLNVDIDFSGDQSIQVYPFLMLPLVENAFKYVGGELNINLKSEVEEAQFRFEITNTKHEDPSLYEGPGGIGLKNLKRRLELLYPDRHQLLIEDTVDMYAAQLAVHY